MAKADMAMVLRVFHELRRLHQISDKVEAKAQELREDITFATNAVIQYAAWPKGSILQDGRYLYEVTNVSLIEPTIEDFRPNFTYSVARVERVLENGQLDKGDHRFLAQDTIGNYLLLTGDKLVAALAALPRVNPKRPKNPRLCTLRDCPSPLDIGHTLIECAKYRKWINKQPIAP